MNTTALQLATRKQSTELPPVPFSAAPERTQVREPVRRGHTYVGEQTSITNNDSPSALAVKEDLRKAGVQVSEGSSWESAKDNAAIRAFQANHGIDSKTGAVVRREGSSWVDVSSGAAVESASIVALAKDGICGPRTMRCLDFVNGRSQQTLSFAEYKQVTWSDFAPQRSAADDPVLRDLLRECKEGGGGSLSSTVRRACDRYDLPPEFVLAVMKQESGFNQRALSSAGAIGRMQLMPGTARELGVDPHDPDQNIIGGVAYLKQQYDRFGSFELALAAYNAGPERVARTGGIPPIHETQDYVKRIMHTYNDLKNGRSSGIPAELLATSQGDIRLDNTLIVGDSILSRAGASKHLSGQGLFLSASQGRSLDDMVQHLRADLERAHPKQVVLGGGTNNLDDPEKVKRLLEEGVEIIRKFDPSIKVYVATTLPYEGQAHRTSASNDIAQFVRESLSKRIDGVVDLRRAVEENGKIAARYSGGDGVHPNPTGYRALAQEIRRTVAG